MRKAVAARAFVLAVAGWAFLCAFAQPAAAQDRRPGDPRRGGYFIEFRARPSTFIGHTYVVYGRQGPRGRLAEQHYAGLIPEGDVWEGLWSPIRATVRKYKDDVRLRPDTIYRRRLTLEEYRYVERVVRFLRGNEREWHAIFQNCNDFGIIIAEALELNRPPSLMPPSMWVGMLRVLNDP